MKAKHADFVKKFTDIPNIGPAIEKDFLLIGLRQPKNLKGKNAFTLYKKLCTKTGTRHDPCVLDTFMAAIDFMNGGKPKVWWKFTEERKKLHSQI